MGLDRSDSAYYIRPRTTDYKIRTRRTEEASFHQPENVIEENLGTVAQRIARLKSHDESFSGHDISGTWKKQKRTKSIENLDKLDTLEDKVRQNASVSTVDTSEAQNDDPSGQSGSLSSEKERRYFVAQSESDSSSSSKTSSEGELFELSEETRRVESSSYDHENRENQTESKYNQDDPMSEEEIEFTFQNDPNIVHSKFQNADTYSISDDTTKQVTFEKSDDENIFDEIRRAENREQKMSEPDSVGAPLTSVSSFYGNSVSDETPGFLLKTTTVFESQYDKKEESNKVDSNHHFVAQNTKSPSEFSGLSQNPKQKFSGVEECLIEFDDHYERISPAPKALNITAVSRKIEREPEGKTPEPVQVHHSRVKLKGSSDDERVSNEKSGALTANMILQGYSTGFTDGESTNDELADSIQRHSIFIYKGQNPTWRVGPILNDPRCWLSSDAKTDYEEFMEAEKNCRSFHFWMEFGRGGWVRSGIFSIREYGFGAQNLGHCNGTFNSPWKSKVIPGIYDRKIDENGDIYFERVAFAKGTPNMAGIVDGEDIDLPLLNMREGVKVRTSADFLVEKNVRVDTLPKHNAPMSVAEDIVDAPGLRRDESFRQEENLMQLTSGTHDIEKRVPYFLYKHGNCWKIGQTAGAARAVLMTMEKDFRKLDRSKWIEVERNTRNSKKLADSDVIIRKHPFAHNLIQIEASLRSQEPISGIYYELEDQEDVWKLTTSVYLNGKFVTEWKNATLPGWYDRIGPEIFMSRHLNEADKQELFIYKKSGRWHVGPDPREKICWLFSGKNERHLHEQTRWFEADKGQKWTRNRSITAALRH